MNGGHEMDWVRACKEPEDDRTMPSSTFDYAGPLTEVVLMGNLAVRLQDLKRTLQWNGDDMQITNIDDDDEIRVVTSDSFEVVNGDPRFETDYDTINAKQAAQEYI